MAADTCISTLERTIFDPLSSSLHGRGYVHIDTPACYLRPLFTFPVLRPPAHPRAFDVREASSDLRANLMSLVFGSPWNAVPVIPPAH